MATTYTIRYWNKAKREYMVTQPMTYEIAGRVSAFLQKADCGPLQSYQVNTEEIILQTRIAELEAKLAELEKAG